MKFLRLNHKGDTIIEVMLAMALLTAFLFISWGITNKSTQMGINARKRTEMVNAMKEQAEALKAMYVQNGSSVATIIDRVGRTTNGLDEQSCNPDALSGATDNENGTNFHYAQNGTSIDKIHQKKQLPDENNRVWVQYRPESGETPTYYDFYIRACWQTVGSTQNTDNAQFMVRLNMLQGGSIGEPIPEEPTDPYPDIARNAYLVFGYFDYPASASPYSPQYTRNGDHIVSMNVTEEYDDDGYLEKITLQLKPVRSGPNMDRSLVFDIDGQSAPASIGMFDGNGTIRKTTQLRPAGSPVIDVTNHTKLENPIIFDWRGNACAVGHIVCPDNTTIVTVEVTNIDKSEANRYGTRGSFNPKRYRFIYMVDGDRPIGMPAAIDLADINPNMFYTVGSKRMPQGFYVPEPFTVPTSQFFDQAYCGFQDHVDWLYSHRNDPVIPYDTEPASSAEWYKRSRVGGSC